jgi:hypothetical protein
MGASRLVQGVKIPHPCGRVGVLPDVDRAARMALITAALEALGSEMTETTVLDPCATW